MSDLIPVLVECHSGYKADEYPRCFYLGDVRYEITEITDRWFQSDRYPEWPESDYFKVKTKSGGQYIIKHELKSDLWYIVGSKI
ncbi:MAG: cytoplasmic protein [Bacteroidota bacterium]|nr:cytoplasmic protein [Bacteroidota bacterium]